MTFHSFSRGFKLVPSLFRRPGESKRCQSMHKMLQHSTSIALGHLRLNKFHGAGVLSV
jgi:hypothetical protein